MKKNTINKFARVALAIAKNDRSGRAAITWSRKNGEYTLATSYYFIRFTDDYIFEAIQDKVGSANMAPGDIHDKVTQMLYSKNHQHLKDTGLLHQDNAGRTVRFLANNAFPVAINEIYLDIFQGEYRNMCGTSHVDPIILLCDGYTAGIFPVYTCSKDDRFRRMKDLLNLYGI